MIGWEKACFFLITWHFSLGASKHCSSSTSVGTILFTSLQIINLINAINYLCDLQWSSGARWQLWTGTSSTTVLATLAQLKGFSTKGQDSGPQTRRLICINYLIS